MSKGFAVGLTWLAISLCMVAAIANAVAGNWFWVGVMLVLVLVNANTLRMAATISGDGP